MAVESPPGRKEQVAAPHGHRVAVDDGPDSFAFQDEPERRLGVPVLGGALARCEVLDSGPERRGCVGVSRQARISEADSASLAAPPDGDEFRAPRGKRVQLVPPPQVRHRAWRGVSGHEPLASRPQRGHADGGEVAVELVELGLVLRAVEVDVSAAVLDCGHGRYLRTGRWTGGQTVARRAAMSSRSAFLSIFPTLVVRSSPTSSSRSGHL